MFCLGEYKCFFTRGFISSKLNHSKTGRVRQCTRRPQGGLDSSRLFLGTGIQQIVYINVGIRLYSYSID